MPTISVTEDNKPINSASQQRANKLHFKSQTLNGFRRSVNQLAQYRDNKRFVRRLSVSTELNNETSNTVKLKSLKKKDLYRLISTHRCHASVYH